jgi:hypothetical protein
VEAIQIELDDAAAAAALRAELRTHGFEVECPDGACLVSVDLIERNPEQRVERVLSVVDAWAARAGSSGVAVHIDGTRYLLNPR